MDNELTLYLTEDLQAMIKRVRELNELVKRTEVEAKAEYRDIDYTNFPEYAELHNLHRDVHRKLGDCACSALSVNL